MMKLLSTSLLLFLLISVSFSCEIETSIYGDAKDIYKSGDEIIFKVHVILPHRNCRVAIDKTEYEANGLELLGATPWKQEKSQQYVQYVKTKVKDDAAEKATLQVTRTCNKEGGYNEFIVNIDKTK